MYLDDINKALSEVTGSGSFCTSGRFDAWPTIKVKGLGAVDLPLTPVRARQLRDKCYQAPFGRGEDTLVDTRIRNTWQLDAADFSVHGAAWLAELNDVAQEIGHAMGLGDIEVTSNLYKLLVYEKGGFFSSHRDTEKIPGMFATLSIVLPSAHEGGLLTVRHGDAKRQFRFGGKASDTVAKYAAFYADCQHDVSAVKGGYRLSLVYNLAVRRPTRKSTVSALTKRHATVANALQRWAEDADTDKLICVLDHKYTQANLHLDNLKNRDRQVATMLIEAAAVAECDVRLGLVSLHEVVAGEVPYEYSRRRRWGWGRSYDADTDTDADPEDFVAYDTIESDFLLSNLLTPGGKKEDFGDIPVDREEFVGGQGLDAVQPESVSVMEATGNEGATMDRWYRAAAVVVWPKARRYEVLTRGSRSRAVTLLRKRVASPTRANSTEVQQFARALLQNWRHGTSQGPEDNRLLFESIRLIGDAALVEDALKTCLMAKVHGTEGGALAALVPLIGWRTLGNQVRNAMQAHAKSSLFAAASVVADLWEAPTDSTERARVCGELTALALDLFGASIKGGWEWRRNDEELLPALIRIVCSVDDVRHADALMLTLMRNLQRFDPCNIVASSLCNLASWAAPSPSRLDALRRMAASVTEHLNHSIARPLAAPTDWARSANLSCKCGDCTTLFMFLTDPQKSALDIRAAKDRRAHLHHQIDTHGLDVTHVTLRQGSPYTLQCRKTQGSYERAVVRRKVEMRHLAALHSAFGGSNLPDQ